MDGIERINDGGPEQPDHPSIKAIREAAHRFQGDVPPLVGGIWWRSHYQAAAAQALRRIGDLTGIAVTLEPDRVHVVDRAELIDLMLSVAPQTNDHNPPGSRWSFDWLIETMGSRAIGWVVATMSRYVAALYMPPYQVGQAKTGLNVVHPTLRLIADSGGVPVESIGDVAITHEAVRHWQFAAHPWLDPYLGHLRLRMDAISKAMRDRARASRHPHTWVFQEIARAVMDSKTSQADTTLRAYVDVVRDMTNVLTLIEGHADFVERLVSERYLPGHKAAYDAMRAGSAQRIRISSPLEKIVLLTLGRAKASQYVEGSAFWRKVYEAGGMDLVNRGWESSATLPTAAEIKNPSRWIERMNGHSVEGIAQ